MEIRNFTDIKSLLFDNKTVKQTIFKNTFWLAGAEGMGKMMKLILLIYVARILGATDYGKFSFALAFIGLFSVLATLGLSRIVVREFSQNREKEKDFSAIFSLRIIFSLIVLVLIIIGSFFITPDDLIRKLIWILAVYTLLEGLTSFLNFFFQARQKMEYEAGSKIFRMALLTILGLIIVFFFPSVENLSYAYLFSAVFTFIVITIIFHFKFYRLGLNLDKMVWKRYLKMSWPLIISGIFITIYGQIDSVMMGYFNQITETGWYNAALRIAGAAFIPIGLISTSFYPALSKTIGESKNEFRKNWANFMKIMIILSVLAIIGGILLAPMIINLIYGSDYNSSIFAFQILIVMVGISFLHNPFNQALIISNQQKKFFWASLVGVIVNIVLNLILIPKYSLYGAAAASAITSFIVLLFLLGITWRFTSIFNNEFKK